MKIKKFRRLGIGFLSVVFLSGLVWATESTNLVGLAMPLNQQGGTARAMSMGSAMAGVPQGSASLLWNPAGLGRLGECKELGLHHNSGLVDTIQETVVFGMPIGSLGGFAASLNYVNNGTFEGRDEVGNVTDNYTAGDMGGSLGWGREWFNGFSAGIAVKYNRQTLDDKSYDAYASDLGILWKPKWKPLSRWNLGLTYSNFGTKIAGDILDQGLRVGGSYSVNKDLLLAVASELKASGFNNVNVGVENWFHPIVALRAGYVYNFTDSKLTGLTGLTGGIGVKATKNILVDYAYIPFGDLGFSQRLSLTYKFGCPKKEVVKVVLVKPEPIVETKVVVIKDVKLIVLEDGHFEFDSATLTIQGALAVIANTQILKDNPEAKIRVAGYTSARGTEEYNQKLSERRAESVRAILINVGGIAPERITTIGYGETRPAEYEPIPSDIDSSEANANMRVLFEIITK